MPTVQLAKFLAGDEMLLGTVEGESLVPLADPGGRGDSLHQILESDDPIKRVGELRDPKAKPIPLASAMLMADQFA
jgi:hypothetical protein